MATKNTLLDEVKAHLTITLQDDDLDKTLQLKIDAVCAYLKDGGACLDEEISANTVSCIAIGVNDLLNGEAGGTKFSPAFNMLAKQVCRG